MIDPLVGEAAPLPQTTTRPGVVVDVDGVLRVNVGGVILPTRWADPVVVAAGDAVLVLLTSGPTGQSDATVLCRTTARPRPGTGIITSAPPGASLVTVNTTEGYVEARFVGSYTPNIGDIVLLSWQASTASVVGKVGSIPVPPPPPPPPLPPPPAASSGVLTLPAIDSGTFNASAGVWATGSAPNSASVVQGSYGGSPNFTGAWFYGTSGTQLAGSTVSQVQMYIPARRRIGDYNGTLTLHLYAHGSASRPSGDVGRTFGPYDVTVPPGFGGGWINLPLSWVPTIVAGGGVSIAGNPYIGLAGRNESPQSGTLSVTWHR